MSKFYILRNKNISIFILLTKKKKNKIVVESKEFYLR